MPTRFHVLTAIFGLFLATCPPTNAQLGSGHSTQKETPSAHPPRDAKRAITKISAAESYGRLALSFEANQGQTDERVKFLSRGTGYSLFLTATRAVLALQDGQQNVLGRAATLWPHAGAKNDTSAALKRSNSHVLRLNVMGANPDAEVVGLDELPGKTNYFIGNDPKRWHTNVSTYAKVKYNGIYPGIDLTYYGNQNGQLEYDFTVAPGADANSVALSIDTNKTGNAIGHSFQPVLTSTGDIVVRATEGDIRFEKPVVYQLTADGRKEYREGSYTLGRKVVGAELTTISFSVSDYDHSRALVIDPAIVYSTYLGGTTGGTTGNGIAVFSDPISNHTYAYVSGRTCDPEFPTVKPEQPASRGICSAYITKFDPSSVGTASVLFSTYIGGGSYFLGKTDEANSIAVDSGGSVYITGSTSSTDFPTVNAFQSSNRGGQSLAADGFPINLNAFLTKLSDDGSTLLYSTYFGGSTYEIASSIALDSLGRAYIAGSSQSHDLPYVNPYQVGLVGVFVAVFDTTKSGQSSLLYSTNLGGWFRVDAIAVDSPGYIHLGGICDNQNFVFPVVNGFQIPSANKAAAIYAKLNPAANGAAQIVYSTDLGGGGDEVDAIALDSAGNAYLSGSANSGVFPETSGATEVAGDSDLFIAKINPSLIGSASLVYSNYFRSSAGPTGASVSGIAVDGNGDVFVVGAALPGLPLVNPVMSSANGIMQSLDGGQTWTVLSQGLTGFPITALAVDASTSPRTLYAGSCGGVCMGISTTRERHSDIFRSTDGGLTWSQVFELPDSEAPDFICNTINQGGCIFTLAIDLINSANVYVGTTSGVFKSSDRGSTWIPFSTGLAADRSQFVTGLTFDGGTLYAGTPAALYALAPGAASWAATGLVRQDTGDLVDVAVDPTTTPHTLYVGGPNQSFISSDGGKTWLLFSNGGIGVNAQFGAPLMDVAVDTSTSPSTLYGYDWSDGVRFKGTNGGNTWVEIPLADNDQGDESQEANIVVDSTSSPSRVYFNVVGSQLFASGDGGNTWSLVPTPPLTALAVDPTVASASSPGALYAAQAAPVLNAYLIQLNPSGSNVLFSTYLGGAGTGSKGQGIALDSSNNIYLTGMVNLGSSEGTLFCGAYVKNTFTTINAYQATDGNCETAFFTELGSPTLPTTSGGPVSTQVGVQTGTLAITFPNIQGSATSTPPTLTVTPLSSTSTANFSLSNNLGAYDISTTALFSGSVTLCVQALTVNDLTTFNSLTLLHIVNGVAVNITTSYNFPTRTICGSTSSFSPFVLVKGVVGQIQDLITAVTNLDLKHGIQTSFDAKLQNASQAYSSAAGHDYTNVCNVISAFINEVEAQTGQTITTSEAAPLLSAARQVKATIGCQ